MGGGGEGQKETQSCIMEHPVKQQGEKKKKTKKTEEERGLICVGVVGFQVAVVTGEWQPLCLSPGILGFTKREKKGKNRET